MRFILLNFMREKKNNQGTLESVREYLRGGSHKKNEYRYQLGQMGRRLGQIITGLIPRVRPQEIDTSKVNDPGTLESVESYLSGGSSGKNEAWYINVYSPNKDKIVKGEQKQRRRARGHIITALAATGSLASFLLVGFNLRIAENQSHSSNPSQITCINTMKAPDAYKCHLEPTRRR